MSAEFGLFCLALALVLSGTQSLYLFCTPLKPALGRLLYNAAWWQALLIALALTTLINLRLESDFSVANVAQHSNLALPLLYKITGSWGNHEGSLLLWVVVLSLCGVLAIKQGSPHESLIKKAIAVQSALVAFTLLFILATSNPFARLFPAPADGAMLNPLLQDIALAIHPPMLYAGYVGFSIVFSFAVAALLEGKAGRELGALMHPWILGAWSFLTLGIGLGSWWAYRELGWGGFWFWDPVENASLLPWLAGTALLHSNIVLKKRGLLGEWVLLLSIVTFGLSLLGTFLVRSGVITSVHSFASDPARGIFILAFLLLSIGGALVLYALRIGKSDQKPLPMRPSSREGVIVINNLFLLTACATVLLGTLYPLFIEWFSGEKISVGAPYFHATFLPLMAIPLLFAGLAPFMAWKKARIKAALHGARLAIVLAMIAFIFSAVLLSFKGIYPILGFALAGWLAGSSVEWIRGVRLRTLSHWSVCVAHLGAALLVVGISGAGYWSQEIERYARPGDKLQMGGYDIVFDAEGRNDTENFSAKVAELHVFKGDELRAVLHPEYRTYNIRSGNTSEAALYSTPLFDLYSVIGETDSASGRTALRIYYKPAMLFIWLGCVMMAAGGVIGLLRGRRRA